MSRSTFLNGSVVSEPASFREPVEFAAHPSGESPAAPSGSGVQPALASGRTVQARSLNETDDVITVRGASGDVELTVRMTAEGPVLRFRSASLNLESTGSVRVDCEEFHVRAKERIVEESGGDLRLTASGDASISIGGGLTAQAHTVDLGSRRGDVRIRANDDVRLNGERVKLNC